MKFALKCSELWSSFLVNTLRPEPNYCHLLWDFQNHDIINEITLTQISLSCVLIDMSSSDDQEVWFNMALSGHN